MGFVKNTVQVFHHPVVELSACLSYVLCFALETASKIDHTGCRTREQPLELKWLFVMAG